MAGGHGASSGGVAFERHQPATAAAEAGRTALAGRGAARPPRRQGGAAPTHLISRGSERGRPRGPAARPPSQLPSSPPSSSDARTERRGALGAPGQAPACARCGAARALPLLPFVPKSPVSGINLPPPTDPNTLLFSALRPPVGPPAAVKVLALVVSSHPRCGAESPLRGLVTPAMSSQLWDACCTAPGAKTHFCLMVTGILVLADNDAQDALMRLSVSTLTGGITRAPSVSHLWGVEEYQMPRRICKYGLVDSNSFITGREIVGSSSGAFEDDSLYRFVVVDRAGNEKRWLTNGTDDDSFVSAGNKWWVHISFTSFVMTVAGLQGLPAAEPPAEVSVKLPKEVIVGSGGNLADWLYAKFFFSGTDPDEGTAMYLHRMNSLRSLLFVVVDIGSTHRTKSLVVTHSSVANLPVSGWVSRLLAFRCPHTNHRTFIGEIRSTGLIVSAFALVNGNVINLGEEPYEGLSQLNESQFCLQRRNCYEIWDCNDLSHPVKSLPHVFSELALMSPMIQALSGMIFHGRESAQVIAVTDQCGVNLVMLHFSRRTHGFHVFNSV
ncbi:hypothetical protein Pelo_7417 [Pelomyxa schiedti]|nr:hypothetical protein Pelo_7417 [Pelomyxa schiedti]